ncbi:MAG: helix-turn-helix domain-containing protein [SAR324 cluster bacterium]|nr:helix-turn-helix domain-containing protein [SAR324 cluster bacterium]
MAKATTYSFQGKEWTVKDLAEELDLSTHRVYRLLKDHNEDLKAIFESRGITIKKKKKLRGLGFLNIKRNNGP